MQALEATYTTKPFAQALGELLRRRPESGPLGRISLRRFVAGIDGWQYEYLRKMITCERPLRSEAIEAMAAKLGVTPDYFLEYRDWQMCEALRRHPELVDLAYPLIMAEARVLDEQKARTGDAGRG